MCQKLSKADFFRAVQEKGQNSRKKWWIHIRKKVLQVKLLMRIRTSFQTICCTEDMIGKVKPIKCRLGPEMGS